MTRDVSLTSQVWCELVFEGRNKYYGAYELRQKSSDRHLKAILIVAAAIVSILLVTKMWGKINEAIGDAKTSVTTPVTMTSINLTPPKPEERIVTEKPQEVVKVKSAMKFTIPTIDKSATEEDDLLTQEALTKSKSVIFHTNIDGDDRDPTSKDPHEAFTSEVITKTVEVTIHETAEIMPVYPGGDLELMRYLSESLRYPTVDMENGVHGRVVLRFVIGIDGSISNVQIVKSVSTTCDREAIRVVKSMKNWIPGRQNGVAVPVYFSLPIRFKLENT